MARLYSLRLWPNGEFGIGFVRKLIEPSLVDGVPPEQPCSYSWTASEILGWIGTLTARGYSPDAIAELLDEKHARTLRAVAALGLSEPANSHKRAERGSKGITSHGRRMLRNGCFLLERANKRGSVAMVTTTIPTVPSEVYKDITREWPEIVRTFTQWLSRRMKAAHIDARYCGCVEIQEKRMQRYGGLPLHLHLVFCSKSRRGYIVSKTDVLDAWKRAVCSRVPAAGSVSWIASTRIETVKKSVSAYLSKYISKGITDNVVRTCQEGYSLPSSWWVMSSELRRAIAAQTIASSGDLAAYVWERVITDEAFTTWKYEVTFQSGELSFVCGISGALSRAAINEIKRIRMSLDRPTMSFA